MLPLALSNGDAIILIVLLAVPIAAFSFLGAGKAFDQIGKGQFSIEQEIPQKGSGGGAPVSAEVREAEIRQFLEAKSYRRELRGEPPLDIEAELAKATADASPGAGSLARDAQLVSEVRELVIARNARRERQGKEPLDVESEVARQLSELEGLGQ